MQSKELDSLHLLNLSGSFSLRLCFHQWRYREYSNRGFFMTILFENSYNNHPWIHRFFFWWIPMFFHPPPGAWRLRISELSFFCCKSSTKVPSAAAWEKLGSCEADVQCWPRLLKEKAILKFKTALVRFFRKYTLISATALAHINLYMYVYTYNMCVRLCVHMHHHHHHQLLDELCPLSHIVPTPSTVIEIHPTMHLDNNLAS